MFPTGIGVGNDVIHFNEVKNAGVRRRREHFIEQTVVVEPHSNVLLHFKTGQLFIGVLAGDDEIVNPVLGDEINEDVVCFDAEAGQGRQEWRSR